MFRPNNLFRSCPIEAQLLSELANSQSARWQGAPEWITVQLEGKGQLADVRNIRYLGDNWIVISREELLQQEILSKKPIRKIGLLHPASKLSAEFKIEAEIAASCGSRIDLFQHSCTS
jgi:hypothetical protein